MLGVEVREEALFQNFDDTYRYGLASGQGGKRLNVDGSYVHERGLHGAAGPAGPGQDRAPGPEPGAGLPLRQLQGVQPERQEQQQLQGAAVLGADRRASSSAVASTVPFARRTCGSCSLRRRSCLEGTADICAGDSPTATLEQCQRTGVSRGAVRPHPGEPGRAVQLAPRREPAAGRREGEHDHRRCRVDAEADHRPRAHGRLLRHQDRQARSTTCSRTTPSRPAPPRAIPPCAT